MSTWFRRLHKSGAAHGEVHCSFCKKSQNDVRKIVAATEAAICDECVSICIDTIGKDSEDDAALALKRKLAYFREHLSACAVCGAYDSNIEYLVVPSVGSVCPACVNAVHKAAVRECDHGHEE